MRRIFTAVFAAVAVSGAASAADEINVVEIEFNPSDLTQVERLEALRKDIRRAALDVCEARQIRSLTERRMARECVAEAVRGGEAQLDVVAAR